MPRLGLVCITDCDTVRFRALTRKRYLALPSEERLEVLRALFADNLARLNGAIEYCLSSGISLYRVTSHLFPFADEPEGRDVLMEFASELKQTGERALAGGIRLVVHPDQFVVLNSDTPEVIQNSIKVLTLHGLIFDLLGLERSTWAAINLHGGKGGRSDRLVDVVGQLDDSIRLRLTFENDERAYGADEILDVCRRAGVSMIFDAHHHLVREKLPDYDYPSVAYYTEAARETWPDPSWQIVHISNGREFTGDSRHSDLIETMPASFRAVPWIEVEAKRKELAIEKLRREWNGVEMI